MLLKIITDCPRSHYLLYIKARWLALESGSTVYSSKRVVSRQSIYSDEWSCAFFM